MRFLLTFHIDGKYGRSIPVNYQYEVSSWIYRVLNRGNNSYASWLHEKGFGTEKKPFRLFTFSRLDIPRFRIDGDRLILGEGPLSLIISFMPVTSTEYFIQGLFRDQSFELGDRKSRVKLDVRSVEKLPEKKFSGNQRFRCLSPVVVSYRDRSKERYARYLGPDEDGYDKLIVGNLINKFRSYGEHGKGGAGLNGKKVDAEIFRITVPGRPRSKLITIRQGMPGETRVRGYLYEFIVEGLPELIRLGYYAGFGEKNSLGFGCVKVVE